MPSRPDDRSESHPNANGRPPEDSAAPSSEHPEESTPQHGAEPTNTARIHFQQLVNLSRFSGRPDPDAVDPSRFSGRFGKLAAEDMDLPLADDDRPNAGRRVRRRRRLQVIAAQQGGCFTIPDTELAGYDRRARHHHLRYGNWRTTAAPKVYRLTGWPTDTAEPLHAWLLWAGAGAALTSWSAIGAHGYATPIEPTPVDRTPPDPSSPVHLIRPRPAVRRDRLDTRPVRDGLVLFHHRTAPELQGEVIDGLAVRPLAEALCVAVATSTGVQAAAASALVDSLLERELVDLRKLVDIAQRCNASRMLDLLWPRLRPVLRNTG